MISNQPLEANARLAVQHARSNVDPEKVFQELKFVGAEELYEELKKGPKEFRVIDDRTTEEIAASGKIVDAKIIESSTFDQDIEEIKDQLKHVPKLYFHCAYSQSRGPKSAQKYFDSIKGNKTCDQEVFVLLAVFPVWHWRATRFLTLKPD